MGSFLLLGLGALVVLSAAAWATYVLLFRVSAQGGAIDGDASDIAAQILAEQDGFRGSRSSKSAAWDGVNRLAPPTQPGGAVGGEIGGGDGGGG